MLPARVGKPLAVHLRRVRELHERDRASGGGRVELPGALERKAPAWGGGRGPGSGSSRRIAGIGIA
jgi:hypothetical protein